MVNTSDYQSIPGINIQAPWSFLIASGRKSIETRNYALPEKFIDKPLAIIETPGNVRPTFKARIIGEVVFSSCKLYQSYKEWASDAEKHLVPPEHPLFCFREDRSKYGWIISYAVLFKEVLPPPTKRGIVFAHDCLVPAMYDENTLKRAIKETVSESFL